MNATISPLTSHYKTLHHCHSSYPTIIVTINAISKSDGIQNLKITDLHRHLLFDSSVDPALLAGVDDYDEDNDEHTSLAGVHDKDTSITGVPVPNTQPNHDSVDPNEANNNSNKESIQSTGSDISIHRLTSEPPQPLLNKEPHNVELPKLEAQVPILHQLERVKSHCPTIELYTPDGRQNIPHEHAN